MDAFRWVWDGFEKRFSIELPAEGLRKGFVVRELMKILEGLIAEGWRKDEVLRCGRFAEGVTKPGKNQSAEGLWKDCHTYRFCTCPKSPKSIEFLTVRKVRGRVRGSKFWGGGGGVYSREDPELGRF